MAIFNGTLSVLKADGTQIAELTDCSLDLPTNMFDVTSKESGGYKKIMPGLRSATCNATGIVDFVATNKDMADLLAYYTGRTAVTILFSNGVVGDKSVSFSSYMSACSISAPMEDKVSYDITFESTGTITVATIS